MTRFRRLRGAAALIATTLILAGCAETPLSTFGNESDIARDLSSFLWWLLAAAAVVFVLVQGAVLYMASKFRVKAPEDESQVYPDEEFPEQIHGNTSLEIGWTILPTVIMAVVAFFTLGLLFDLEDVEGLNDPDRQIQSVTVVGQQWWWEFQYHLDDDGIPDIVTANELVLPVGEEIPLDVTSRDVIHSFWVPALNGKRDAVPGTTNTWTIQTTSEGRFPGECTEFCGLSHAFMENFAIGVTPPDFAAWATNQQRPAEIPAEGTAARAGHDTFVNNCASCHIINGITDLAIGNNPELNNVGNVVPVTTGLIEGEDYDTVTAAFEHYDGANRFIDRQTQVSGAAPNLTHFASRSSFAGGIFEMYSNTDRVAYTDLADAGRLNIGDLEAWIVNAPEQKANAWDSPAGGRGMTPFESLSDEEVDQLVEFLMSLD